MKTLLDWIKDAQAKRAHSMRLAPNQNLMYRTGKTWVAMPGQIWSAADVRNLVWSLLTSEEKKQLEETRSLAGFFRGSQGPIRFQFLSSETGVTAVFKWHAESERDISDWNLPAFTLEKLQRQSGLSLFYGPVESGKSTLLFSLAAHVANQAGPVLFFSDLEEFSADPFVHVYPAQSLLSMNLSDLPSRFVFVDSENPEVQKLAMDLSQVGASVFMSSRAQTLSAALMKLSHVGVESTQVWMLLSETLNVAMGLRLVSGLETGLQPVFELLADTPEIKAEIHKGTVFSLVEMMAKGGDKSGMRTLNQALLQLLLKRKIELRTGFDESPNPQELDELLKRVGV